MKSRYPRSAYVLALSFFMGVGTYNAIVINSQSSINCANIKFVKRLDELYGVTQPARLVANSLPWQKIPAEQVKILKEKGVIQEVRTIMAAPSDNTASPDAAVAAAVKEDLNLSLVEVVNPKKWQQGLTPAQFTGSLTTSGGTIESLNVSLPNGEGVSVSFSEMTGNVFEYDLAGEIYSGMMYQVDQNSFMISLSNGPLEGTRLKFMGEQPAVLEQQAEAVAASEGTNSETDNYGNNSDQMTPEEIALRENRSNPEMQAQEAPPVSDFQPAPIPVEQPPMEQQPVEQPQVDVAFQQATTPEEAANLDVQFQQQAEGYNLETQPQVN